MAPSHHVGKFSPKTKGFFPHDFTLIASFVGESVIGHGIGGKYIPIMACLAKARRWSKWWQTCLSSPDLTATHNEWWLKDPSTFMPRTTERSYDILRSVSYESQWWILDACAWQVSRSGSPTRSKWATHVSRLSYKHGRSILMFLSVKIHGTTRRACM